MFSRKTRITALATACLVVGGLLPLSAQAAQATTLAAPAAVSAAGMTKAFGFGGPIARTNIWSAILRMVLSISKHAGQRMAQRGMTQAQLKHVVNEGKVISRSGGVTKIRSGQWEVRVNSKTGNVITVIKHSGGGGVSGGR